jgi:hypothetical protein
MTDEERFVTFRTPCACRPAGNLPWVKVTRTEIERDENGHATGAVRRTVYEARVPHSAMPGGINYHGNHFDVADLAPDCVVVVPEPTLVPQGA